MSGNGRERLNTPSHPDHISICFVAVQAFYLFRAMFQHSTLINVGLVGDFSCRHRRWILHQGECTDPFAASNGFIVFLKTIFQKLNHERVAGQIRA